MKNILLSFSLLMIGLGSLRSQDISLWVRLSEDRVLTECGFSDVSSETLFVFSGNRLLPVPLSEVCQIRAMKISSISDGVLIGSGCGVIIGSLLGLSLNSAEKSNLSTGATCIAFAVLGGIVGGTMASLEKPGDLISLNGRRAEEKVRLIREVVRRVSLEQP